MADGEGVGPRQKVAEDLAIPKNAVKRIMKLDPEVGAVSAEAVIAVAKATEIFLEKFATDSYNIAVEKNRKTVRYEDIADARTADSTLEVLHADPWREMRGRVYVLGAGFMRRLRRCPTTDPVALPGP